MLFSSRKRQRPPPAPPNPVSNLATRTIDRLKRRIAATLSRWEQRWTARQKKYGLFFFCALLSGFFVINLYRSFFLHRTSFPAGWNSITPPSPTPALTPPPKSAIHIPDTTLHPNRPDSTR